MKKFIVLLAEYLICAAICTIAFHVALSEALGVELKFLQWFAIILIVNAVLPNPIKPSSQ